MILIVIDDSCLIKSWIHLLVSELIKVTLSKKHRGLFLSPNINLRENTEIKSEIFLHDELSCHTQIDQKSTVMSLVFIERSFCLHVSKFIFLVAFSCLSSDFSRRDIWWFIRGRFEINEKTWFHILSSSTAEENTQVLVVFIKIAMGARARKARKEHSSYTTTRSIFPFVLFSRQRGSCCCSILSVVVGEKPTAFVFFFLYKQWSHFHPHCDQPQPTYCWTLAATISSMALHGRGRGRGFLSRVYEDPRLRAPNTVQTPPPPAMGFGAQNQPRPRVFTPSNQAPQNPTAQVSSGIVRYRTCERCMN